MVATIILVLYLLWHGGYRLTGYLSGSAPLVSRKAKSVYNPDRVNLVKFAIFTPLYDKATITT